MSLGADIDLAEAYEWGWAELARIEAEMAIEAGKISPGASLDEAASVLDQTEYVDRRRCLPGLAAGPARRAIERLDGVQFDIAAAAAPDRGGAGPGLDVGGGLLHAAERGPEPGPAGPGGRSAAGTGSRSGRSCPPSSTRACPATTCRTARP